MMEPIKPGNVVYQRLHKKRRMFPERDMHYMCNFCIGDMDGEKKVLPLVPRLGRAPVESYRHRSSNYYCPPPVLTKIPLAKPTMSETLAETLPLSDKNSITSAVSPTLLTAQNSNLVSSRGNPKEISLETKESPPKLKVNQNVSESFDEWKLLVRHQAHLAEIDRQQHRLKRQAQQTLYKSALEQQIFEKKQYEQSVMQSKQRLQEIFRARCEASEKQAQEQTMKKYNNKSSGRESIRSRSSCRPSHPNATIDYPDPLSRSIIANQHVRQQRIQEINQRQETIYRRHKHYMTPELSQYHTNNILKEQMMERQLAQKASEQEKQVEMEKELERIRKYKEESREIVKHKQQMQRLYRRQFRRSLNENKN